jgi:hypothetical protein
VWHVAAPRLIIPSALALATLTLAACSAAPVRPSGGEASVCGVAGGSGAAVTTGPGPATPESSAPTASAGLTADAYKSELDTKRKEMLGAINGISGARSLKTLDKRVQGAQEQLLGAANDLAAMAPPQEVRAQHDAYVTSLRDFATQLGTTAGKVTSRNLCTSGAVLTDLGGSLKSLDQAGGALQSAGFPADVVTVKAKGKQSRRLGNGHYLRKGSMTGRSSLQIDNGATRDAVITVVKGKSKAFSVYVRKKSKFKVRGVRDGSYKIYFMHGVDWDGKSKTFSRECSYERFQKSVKFKTTFTSTQILWHDWRVTLHAIRGGNARTSDVDPDQFPS